MSVILFLKTSSYWKKIAKEIIDKVLCLLAELNIKYLIAPYEADGQLAYLYHNKMIDAILTEDSDLLAYKCDNILLKLDAQVFFIIYYL